MTPLASVGGLPFDSLVGGVDLAPHGLRLATPATLRVTPAAAVPGEEVTPFAYRGDGLDLVLAQGGAVGGMIEMPVAHFSTRAVARGSRIQQTTVAESRPYSFEAQYENSVAEALLNGSKSVADLFIAHYDAKLKRRC